MLLHILWMILKIILIIVGAVLGLLFLAVLLLLFCPVRYNGNARKGEKSSDIQAYACVSWLFHGLSVNFQYEDQRFTSRIKIFGIPLDWIQRKGKSLFKKRHRLKKETEDFPASEIDLREEQTGNSQAEPQYSEEEKQKSRHMPAKRPETEETVKKQDPLLKKIKRTWSEFMQKLRRMCRTVQRMHRKAEWWKHFFENQRIKNAVFLIRQELWRILRHVFPVKIKGEITFGCEDPSVTGMILAILGITIPLHRNCIEITPLYLGENFFTGNVYLKGRLYGIVFLIAAVKIYFNKNIKYAISRWKHKEG